MASTEQIEGVPAIADALRVSVDTIKRRLKSGKMPEATKIESAYGDTWVLPRAALSAVAAREGWTIDLRERQARGSSTRGGPVVDGELHQILAAAIAERIVVADEAANAKAAFAVSEAEATRQKALVEQTTRDLEAERAEVSRLTSDLTAALSSIASAEVEIATVRGDLKTAEALAAEMAGRVAAIEKSMGDKVRVLEEVVVDRTAEAKRQMAAMGWWSRRRLRRSS